MSFLKIAKLGNPILRQIAKPVELQELNKPGTDIQTLIDAMINIMREEEGVGLAAPQVSQSLQIVVIESLDNKRYGNHLDIPLAVYINPVITHYSDDLVFGWESCLSLTDFRGFVPRSKKVTVEAYDRQGYNQKIEAEGFLSVVLQHEIDHLNGLVFIDRMPDMTKLAYQEEFETYWVDDRKELTEV